MMGWGGWAGWTGMGLIMVLFWGGLIWLAVALFRRSPEAVVRQQYARGDIDEAQYRRRLLLLERERPIEPVPLKKPRL